ncbi:MAG TPA: hypothetical protein VK009_05140 [Chloroflexota bacterium]|nr:hypothetical protein [Chloroflexota bacterium]
MKQDAISLNETRTLLAGSRMTAFTKAATDAVTGWVQDFHHVAFGQTTRAWAISDLFYHFGQEYHAGDEGVRYGETRGQRYFVVDERILMRFKLLDDGLQSSNYPTDQALDFVGQEPIPDFPPLDRLHIGYRLDITGLLLRDAFVTLPIGRPERFNAWVWQVLGDPIGASSIYGLQYKLPGEFGAAGDQYAYDDYQQMLG